MAHCSPHGIPCPAPLPARDGSLLSERLNGRRRVVLAPCRSVSAPTRGQLRRGRPRTGRPAACRRRFSHAWVETPLAAPDRQKTQSCSAPSFPFSGNAAAPPQGVIPRRPVPATTCCLPMTAAAIASAAFLTFAGRGDSLFDLAITVNDWCGDDDTAVLNTDKTRMLLAAYHAVRPLKAEFAACRQPSARHCLLGVVGWRISTPRPGETVTVRDRRLPRHPCQRIADGEPARDTMRLARAAGRVKPRDAGAGAGNPMWARIVAAGNRLTAPFRPAAARPWPGAWRPASAFLPSHLAPIGPFGPIAASIPAPLQGVAMEQFPLTPPPFRRAAHRAARQRLQLAAQGWARVHRQPGLWLAISVLLLVIFFGLQIVPVVGTLARQPADACAYRRHAARGEAPR